MNVLEKFAKVAIPRIANRIHFGHFVPEDKIDFAVNHLFDRHNLAWLPPSAKREIRALVLDNNRTLRFKDVELGWTSERRLDIGIGSSTTQQADTNSQENNEGVAESEGLWKTIKKNY